jgi:integrase
MSVYKDPRSPYWQYDFQRGGRRFRGSTETRNRREAEALVKRLKDEAREHIQQEEAAETSLKLVDVAARYWIETGQHHTGDGASTTRRELSQLVNFLGPDTLITDISSDDVARLVAWRRAQRIERGGKIGELPSAFTVNDTTEQLKKLFTRAKVWGLRFAREPEWRRHWLTEPEERVNELRGDEGVRLEAAARDEYAPILALAKATGLRQRELLLRWSEVNWDAMTIVKSGKGGKRVTTPITDEVRTILWPLRGQHPEFVFTYVAQRPREGGRRGERHPVTQSGLKTEWRRLRKRAGVVGFRFHDYRHDFATKLLRATGNLKLVSKALNHANIRTTARYAHVQDEDVRNGLEALARLRKSPDKVTDKQSGETKSEAKTAS